VIPRGTRKSRLRKVASDWQEAYRLLTPATDMEREHTPFIEMAPEETQKLRIDHDDSRHIAHVTLEDQRDGYSENITIAEYNTRKHWLKDNVIVRMYVFAEQV